MSSTASSAYPFKFGSGVRSSAIGGASAGYIASCLHAAPTDGSPYAMHDAMVSPTKVHYIRARGVDKTWGEIERDHTTAALRSAM